MQRSFNAKCLSAVVCFSVLITLIALGGPSTGQAAILPVLHYSFDSGTTDGTLGSTVTDLSPAGNHGTVGVASMSQVSGAFGESLTFGGGSFVNVGTPLLTTTDTYQPYSIAFWVKAASGANGGLFTQYSSGTGERFGIAMFNGDGGKVQWWNGSTRAKTTIGVNDNAWHHVAFVKDASRQLTAYVDGQDVTDGTLTNQHAYAFETQNVNIGRFSSTVMPFTGQMDEVFLYEEALTAAQIENLHETNKLGPATLKIDCGSSGQLVQSGWEEITRGTGGTATEVFCLDDQLVTVEMSNPSPGTGPHFNKRAGAIVHPIGDVMADFEYASFSTDHVLTLKDLDAGTYYLRTYHHDETNPAYGPISSIDVSDALGSRQVAASVPITTGSGTVGVFSTVPITLHANGTDDVVVTLSPLASNTTHISGLELTQTLPESLRVDMEFAGGDTQDEFQAFAHPSSSHSQAQELWFFSDLGVDGSVGVLYSTSTGGITPRNRSDVTHELGDLLEDLMPADGDMTLQLTGLAGGEYLISTYHHDVIADRGPLAIDVLDRTGFRSDVVTGLMQTSGTSPILPASAVFKFKSNGIDPVEITFNAGTVILNGFDIVSIPEPAAITLLGIGLIGLLGVGGRRRRR